MRLQIPSNPNRMQAVHSGSHLTVRVPHRPVQHRLPCCRSSVITAPEEDIKQKLQARQQQPAQLGAPRCPLLFGSSHSDWAGGADPLTDHGLAQEKEIVIVRHGETTWNLESRIQGRTNESELTDQGRLQALQCQAALSNMHFDSCFTSPLDRARETAELIWQGREGPVVSTEPLGEANLGWLEGMTNEAAAQARPEEFAVWREKPGDFKFEDGRKPLDEAYERARDAWREILREPGASHLVVTHKSMTRALMGVALGLPPTGFRFLQIGNGSVSVWRINKQAKPILVTLNLTAHISSDDIFY